MNFEMKTRVVEPLRTTAVAVALSAAGLSRIAAASGGAIEDEGSFLDPLREVLERRQSPGETVLEHWRGEWKGSLERLIDYATY